MRHLVLVFILIDIIGFLSQPVYSQKNNKQIDSLLRELSVNHPDTIKIKLLNQISYYYFPIDPNEGIKFGEEAENLSKKINWDKGLSTSYRSLGANYLMKKDLSKTQEYFWNALKINEKLKDRPAIAKSIHNLAVLYHSINMYSKAKDQFEQAFKIYQEIGDRPAMAGCLANIANCYQIANNYPMAKEYYLRSLQIGINLKDSFMISYYQARLGEIFSQLGSFDDAIKFERNALRIYEYQQDSLHIADVNREIGKILHLWNYYDSALHYYQKALFVFKKIKGQESEANQASIYSYMGKIYKTKALNRPFTEKSKLLQVSAGYQKKAITITLPFKIWELLKDYYYELSDVEFQRNNLLSALYYYKQFSAMKDSIYNADRIKEMAKNEIEYEYEKKENQIQLEKEKIISTSKSKTNLILLVSVLLILILSLFILLLKQSTLKKRAIEKANVAHKMVNLEMESLRTQLNPHFMFNSLNAIQELIVTDKIELAQSYLERFAKLLRMLLENASQPFIPLRKEINFLELYLSLEKLRIPDLKYFIKIAPEVNSETTITPNMMLQPYIENALWHGLQHKQGEKRLELFISGENGLLIYEIKDNGVGRKKAEELKSLYRREHQSKGMELISKRFSLLSKEYGQDIQTSVTDHINNGDAVGTTVKITIPSSLSEVKSV